MSGTCSGPSELVDLFEKLNLAHFGGKLQATLAWSGHMRVIAGNCDWRRRTIRLSRLYHKAYPQHMEATMLHEMLHLHLQRGHDAVFQQTAAALGVPLHAPGIAPRRPFKYIYACPQCDRQIKRRRKGNWACAVCGQGVYKPEYRLRLIAHL